MLVEAIKPVLVRFPDRDLRLMPGCPTEIPEEQARKLFARAPDKIRIVGAQWPPECLDSVRKFGTPEARLYPLLNKKVVTPAGVGILRQVFSERAAVVLEEHVERIRFFNPADVLPYADDANGPYRG